MPVLFSYYVEFIPKNRRGPMIGFLASFWMVGNILTSAIAWLIIPKVQLGGYVNDSLWFGSWRIFVVMGSVPALSSALLFFCLPESPKYLYMVTGFLDVYIPYIWTRIILFNYTIIFLCVHAIYHLKPLVLQWFALGWLLFFFFIVF